MTTINLAVIVGLALACNAAGWAAAKRRPRLGMSLSFWSVIWLAVMVVAEHRLEPRFDPAGAHMTQMRVLQEVGKEVRDARQDIKALKGE
jgi:hypothetical protein